MSRDKRNERSAFYFPPFHPNCRCTVIAIDDNGNPADPESLNEGTQELLESYAQETRQTASQFFSSVVSETVRTAFPVFAEAAHVAIDIAFAEGSQTIFNLRSVAIATQDDLVKYGAENSFGFLVDGSKMYLNPRLCNDASELRAMAEANRIAGIFIDYGNANPLKYVFEHEYGHFIYENYESPLSKPLLQVFATRLWNEQCDGKFVPLSATAAISKSEMMAESFAQIACMTDSPEQMGHSAKKLAAFMAEMKNLKRKENELLRTKDVNALMQACFEIIDKVMKN